MSKAPGTESVAWRYGWTILDRQVNCIGLHRSSAPGRQYEMQVPQEPYPSWFSQAIAYREPTSSQLECQLGGQLQASLLKKSYPRKVAHGIQGPNGAGYGIVYAVQPCTCSESDMCFGMSTVACSALRILAVHLIRLDCSTISNIETRIQCLRGGREGVCGGPRLLHACGSLRRTS